ncbi:MAG: hypothetical protein P8J84_02020 [Paracoccaceae bacterium]|nr:hypothetical protein [Paracoccaceae bacterium]
MAKRTTKYQTTPTQPARLSTYEKQTLAEVDWDLLAEMDAEDEGQPVPMQDNPSTKNPAQEASPDPHRQLDDGVMQEFFRRQAEAKAKGPSHSKTSEFQIPMGSPNSLFKKKSQQA